MTLTKGTLLKFLTLVKFPVNSKINLNCCFLKILKLIFHLCSIVLKFLVISVSNLGLQVVQHRMSFTNSHVCVMQTSPIQAKLSDICVLGVLNTWILRIKHHLQLRIIFSLVKLVGVPVLIILKSYKSVKLIGMLKFPKFFSLRQRYLN